MSAGQEPWEISRYSCMDRSHLARYPRLVAAEEELLEAHRQTFECLAESQEEAGLAEEVEEAQPWEQLRMGLGEATREVHPLEMQLIMCPRCWTRAHGTSMRLYAAPRTQCLCRSLLRTP